MEYGLGSSRMDEAVHGNRVLILLLVEYGLGSNGETFERTDGTVLILLMMKSRQQPRDKDTTNPATQQPQH